MRQGRGIDADENASDDRGGGDNQESSVERDPVRQYDIPERENGAQSRQQKQGTRVERIGAGRQQHIRNYTGYQEQGRPRSGPLNRLPKSLPGIFHDGTEVEKRLKEEGRKRGGPDPMRAARFAIHERNN